MDIHITGTIHRSAIIPPEPRYKGWRGLYRNEGGNDHVWDMPAVIPSQWKGVKSGTWLWFTSSLQWLTWDFIRYQNPFIKINNWASVFAGDTVLTNRNGWDDETKPDEQRHDYVQNRYTEWIDPKIMDGIFIAGSFVKLEERADGHLWAVPGWSGVDVTKPLPDIETIWENGWYMRMTICGRVKPYDFAQGQGGAVYVPYMLKEEIPYTKSHFERWESDELPDPLKMYNT